MISRRLLRIKVFHILYAYLQNNDNKNYESELEFSVNKFYDLYLLFFVLLLDVKQYANKRIELAKNRITATEQDLNPNMRFVNNAVLKQIETSASLTHHIEKAKLNWAKNPELIKNIYNQLIASVDYINYMNAENSSYNDDKQLVIRLLNTLAENELLYQIVEDKSIYWNDDLEFVLSMNIRTIQKLNEQSESISLLNLYKNEDDREFAKILLKRCINNHEENSKLIQENIKNWDVDRIVNIDLIIMEMAITEILNFPSIPVKVSLNEYIELAKFYSTEKSSTFINGVLDKIVLLLNNKGSIKKVGRGLQ